MCIGTMLCKSYVKKIFFMDKKELYKEILIILLTLYKKAIN